MRWRLLCYELGWRAHESEIIIAEYKEATAGYNRIAESLQKEKAGEG